MFQDLVSQSEKEKINENSEKTVYPSVQDKLDISYIFVTISLIQISVEQWHVR